MVITVKPKKIEIRDNNLFIAWNDDTESKISLMKLRANCPCAFCSAEREKQSDSYIPLYFNEEIEIKGLELVGKYALGVKWKDGHNTGIFEFDQLKKIS